MTSTNLIQYSKIPWKMHSVYYGDELKVEEFPTDGMIEKQNSKMKMTITES